MREINRVRFDALASYCRDPRAWLSAEEIAWFEEGGERVLGALFRDVSDGDLGGFVLGRDEKNRFRWIGGTGFSPTHSEAKRDLSKEMGRLAKSPEQSYWQGDIEGKPVNFFLPMVPRNRLHKNFILLAESEGYSPARGIIEPMMNWYENLDGNFVEQFQTTGFGSRLWELYLFATFVEMGYRIDNIHSAPDFVCRGLFGEFAVEATTVNPTQGKDGRTVSPPQPDSKEGVQSYLKEYMPIKYASALTSKLKRKYWEQKHVAGKPLIFAIMDFSSKGSMVGTTESLPLYLYGYDYDHEKEKRTGRLHIRPRRVSEHRWGDKRIPSSFFDLPGSENISAVLYSNSGTISKFERMGVVAGFGSKRIRVYRRGTIYNQDPDAEEPQRFSVEVTENGYSESWAEGLIVYHNPKAVIPISERMLPGAGHYQLLPDGQYRIMLPEPHVIASHTFIAVPEADTDKPKDMD